MKAHPRLRKMWMRNRHWMTDLYLSVILTVLLIIHLVK